MIQLDCDAVMRQLWDYLDGELPPDRMEAVRAHLDVCARCVKQAGFERAFLEAVAAARHDYPTLGSLRERVVGRLKANGFSVDAAS